MKSRRTFIQSALAMGTGILVAPLLSFRNRRTLSLPSLKDRNVLFVYGGWDGHEPVKFRDYLVPWLEGEGAKVTTSDSLDSYTDQALMDQTDLVLQIFTMSEISPEQEKGLLAAIKNGTGMAGWHGGMGDAFRKNVDYQFMTGGQWVAHPGGVIDYKVRIIDHEDSVSAKLSDFPMTSEQYYMHVDPNVKVLATTTFNGQIDPWIDGCTIPVAWKKMYGKGRIFYTSVGHNLSHVTDHPDAIQLIKNGIAWASASKYLPPEKWLQPVYA